MVIPSVTCHLQRASVTLADVTVATRDAARPAPAHPAADVSARDALLYLHTTLHMRPYAIYTDKSLTCYVFNCI